MALFLVVADAEVDDCPPGVIATIGATTGTTPVVVVVVAVTTTVSFVDLFSTPELRSEGFVVLELTVLRELLVTFNDAVEVFEVLALGTKLGEVALQKNINCKNILC